MFRRQTYATTQCRRRPYEDNHKPARGRGAACRYHHRHCPSAPHKSADTPGGRGKSAEFIGWALTDKATQSNVRALARPRMAAGALQLATSSSLRVLRTPRLWTG